MIDIKLILFAFFLTNGILGRNIGRGNARHKQVDEEYKFNHPPVPESYEAIPVSVVYEDEGNREEKSINSDISQTSNFDLVNKESLKQEPSTTNKPDITSVNSEIIGFKSTERKPNDPVPDDSGLVEPQLTSTTGSEQGLEIPVAVVYEPESSYYEKTRPTHKRISNKRRKIHRPLAEEKEIVENTDINTNVTQKDSRYDVPLTHNHEEINSSLESSTTQKKTKFDPSGSSEGGQIQQFVRRGELSSNSESRQTQQFSTPSAPSSSESSQLQQFSGHSEQNRSKNRPPQQFSKRDNSTRQRDVVPIVQSENRVFAHSGAFQYSYEGGDGTKAFEKGQLKTYEDDNAGEAVSGGFSYTAKDGKEYSLSYTADENGYRPVGAHLPTPPPIPPAIARALAYLATKTTPEPITESIKESDYVAIVN